MGLLPLLELLPFFLLMTAPNLTKRNIRVGEGLLILSAIGRCCDCEARVQHVDAQAFAAAKKTRDKANSSGRVGL
jgi:hypothetical protein